MALLHEDQPWQRRQLGFHQGVKQSHQEASTWPNCFLLSSVSQDSTGDIGPDNSVLGDIWLQLWPQPTRGP